MPDLDLVRHRVCDLDDDNTERPGHDRREISDAVARTIASLWYTGNHTESVAFVSTGAIPEDSGDLWSRLVPDYDTLGPADQLVADYLGTYLITRAERGPVAGWSTLWIQPV